MDVTLIQALTGLGGAVIGAGAVVIANHFEHKARMTEERVIAERQMYVRLMQQVRKLQTITHRGVTPQEKSTLNQEIAELRGETDVLASKEVKAASSRFFDVMASIADMPNDERESNIVVLDAAILPLLDAIRLEVGTGGIFDEES